MAKMTYTQAREEILSYLAGRGWKVVTRDQRTFKPLQVPYATSPDGYLRLWFKPQAIHFTEGQHDRGIMRSLWLADIRIVGGRGVVEAVNRYFNRSY